jgi:hypothetical protein
MTAREAYYKAYVISSKPRGMLFYMFNQNSTERIGNSQWMIFDKEYHECNIDDMENIEKHIKGFMFWTISPEGEEYIAQKSKKLGKVLSALTFMQK